MSRVNGSADEGAPGRCDVAVSTTGAGARSAQARCTSKAKAVGFLGPVVVAVAIGCAGIEPAQGAECSRNDAMRIAQSTYGGTATGSVTQNGDYLIVQLRLRDGQIIYVSVHRWSC